MKLSHGDSVIIISGRDKGKKGTVMRVLRDQNRVIVSGVNMLTKHIKKTAQTEGKKVRFEASMHVSNVQIVDPKSGKPSRVGYQIDAKTGKKTRVAKLSGTVLSRVKVEAKPVADKDKKIAEPAADGKPAAKKPAFWKKVGFGADAVTGSDAPKAETGPAQTAIPTRSAGRGS